MGWVYFILPVVRKTLKIKISRKCRSIFLTEDAALKQTSSHFVNKKSLHQEAVKTNKRQSTLYLKKKEKNETNVSETK